MHIGYIVDPGTETQYMELDIRIYKPLDRMTYDYYFTF